MRSNITGSYKGLIYCTSVEHAAHVKAQLDHDLENINKNLSSKIKRGCSEYVLTYPEYGKISDNVKEIMQFPKEWVQIETKFDQNNLIFPKKRKQADLAKFCLSDYLVIQKWIDRKAYDLLQSFLRAANQI